MGVNSLLKEKNHNKRKEAEVGVSNSKTFSKGKHMNKPDLKEESEVQKGLCMTIQGKELLINILKQPKK